MFRSHWYARPGWSAASRYLTFHLLPRDQPALSAAVARDQSVLAGIGCLDLVPPRWLHLTVQGVAFRDAVGAADLARLVAAAGHRVHDAAPVRLDLTPVAEVHREGVLYSGTPVEPVADLRRRLRAGIADALGGSAVPGADDEPVWPHLSLAYANAAAPAGEAVAALAALPAPAPLEVAFDRVSLIELRTEGHVYLWEPVADLPLAARP